MCKHEGLRYTSYTPPQKKNGRIDKSYKAYEEADHALQIGKDKRSEAYYLLGLALAQIDQAMFDLERITGDERFNTDWECDLTSGCKGGEG